MLVRNDDGLLAHQPISRSKARLKRDGAARTAQIAASSTMKRSQQEYGTKSPIAWPMP